MKTWSNARKVRIARNDKLWGRCSHRPHTRIFEKGESWPVGAATHISLFCLKYETY